MEDEICEVNIYRVFLGLGFADSVPDARATWLFCNKSGAKDVKMLSDHFNAMLLESGLSYSKGTIIDSSFHEAPGSVSAVKRTPISRR